MKSLVYYLVSIDDKNNNRPVNKPGLIYIHADDNLIDFLKYVLDILQTAKSRTNIGLAKCKDMGAATCGFQQCGILTSVDSDEPVQLPFKLRNYK